VKKGKDDMLTGKWWTIIFIATGFAVFYLLFPYQTKSNEMEKNYTMIEETKLDTATFGSGCFWCTEAIFERLKGVMKVTSGYSGGNVPNPGYEAVCTGKTGHAEVTQILYDPNVITFVELLEVFWKTHDPTTLNRQGNDVGTQYRSVIFFHNDEQKKLAEEYKLKLNEAKIFDNQIVTEISPFKKFYPEGDYHQNYYEKNPDQGYCSFVITPKVEKFKKVFKEKLKAEYK